MSEPMNTEKKVWIAPCLDELAIEKTMGGSIQNFFETSYTSLPGQPPVGPGFGSIPGGPDKRT